MKQEEEEVVKVEEGEAIDFDELLRRWKNQATDAHQEDSGLSEAEEHYRQGQLRARLGGGQAGLECFERAYQLEPANVLYAMDYAVALFLVDRQPEARLVASRIPRDVDYPPGTDAATIFRIGYLFDRLLQDKQRALPFFAEAFERDPVHPAFRATYATTLASLGYLEEATRLATEGIRQLDERDGPEVDDADAYNLALFARILVDADPVEAARQARRALESDPNDTHIHRIAGVIALISSDHREALEHFQRSIQLDPANELAWGGHQSALLSLGFFDDALKEGRKILAHWPGFSEVRYNTAAACLNLGQFEDAERELLECLSTDDQDGAAHAFLGICFAYQRRALEARCEQARARELDPEDPEVKRLCDEIDRFLDGDGGDECAEPLRNLLMFALTALITRRKKV